MSTPLIVILILAASVGAAVLLLIRRLTSAGMVSQCDPEWVANFNISTYRPMLRLLSNDDLRFFAAQKGITAKQVRQLRSERRRVFRAYLRNLVRDFHRLHLAARMTLVYSEVDRPDLATTLIRQKAMFTWAVIEAELQLALHAAGLGAVNVPGLLGALSDMRNNVGILAPNAQQATY